VRCLQHLTLKLNQQYDVCVPVFKSNMADVRSKMIALPSSKPVCWSDSWGHIVEIRVSERENWLTEPLALNRCICHVLPRSSSIIDDSSSCVPPAPDALPEVLVLD